VYGVFFFFFRAEDGIRDFHVTGVQTCALPISSSAFYVALPDCVLAADQQSRAGWIQFGQPLEELGLDLPPRRVIQPRPGFLALFPSYTWHGTLPFDDRHSRLTIAFDMQPRALGTPRRRM